MDFTIRDIEAKDNEPLAQVIRHSLELLDRAWDGTVYTDPTTDQLYEYYQGDRRHYYVVEVEGKIVGGSGIGPIENQDENYCELQKMYLSPEVRGKGIAQALMKRCLDYAKQEGYELAYLETFDIMTPAQKLYKSFGFDYIDHSIGDTGHFSCNVKMTKKL